MATAENAAGTTVTVSVVTSIAFTAIDAGIGLGGAVVESSDEGKALDGAAFATSGYASLRIALEDVKG